MKKKIVQLLLIIIGLAIIAYPIISDFINLYNQTLEITKYQNQIDQLTEEQKKAEIEKQKEYNEELEKESSINISLSENNNVEDEKYKEFLNFDSVIGYISIPKIDILLPIYHGTTKEVLKKGIGHLENTSLPTGGIGNHCVLAGHTAFTGKNFFDDINKLELGDTFTIYNLNGVLKYKVDNIKVVDPYDREAITIDSEKDFVTLLTCTPYGVGSHRLLVRGERVIEKNETEQVEEMHNSEDIIQTEELQKIRNEIEKQIQKIRKYSLIKFLILITIIIIVLISFSIIIFKKRIEAKRYK